MSHTIRLDSDTYALLVELAEQDYRKISQEVSWAIERYTEQFIEKKLADAERRANNPPTHLLGGAELLGLLKQAREIA